MNQREVRLAGLKSCNWSGSKYDRKRIVKKRADDVE
jgi:hypothetical protein